MANVLFLLVSALVYLMVALRRNDITLEYYLKAINMCGAASKHMISLNVKGDWNRCFELMKEYPSQTMMVFFYITIWNFDSMFPDLQKRLDQIIEEECKQN